MTVKGPNGQDLKDFERLASVFWRAESTDGDNIPILATKITSEVATYEDRLKTALNAGLQGQANALDLFDEARRMRSILMTDPSVKNNDILCEYVRNTMIIVDSGDLAGSYEATKDMYAKSIDPHYEGEPVAEETATAQAKVEKPLL